MISIQDNATYIEDISAQEDGYKASATLDFKGTNPSDGNTITFNGTVFTFKDSTANANDVQIGSDISETLDNLLANPNLPSDVTYTKTGADTLFIEYNVIGDSGNNWTIDCDFVSLPSGLSGGSDVPDTDWVKAANTTFIGHPREIPLASDTDTSSINSFRSFSNTSGSKFVEGARVLVIDSANNIESLTLGSITTSGSYGKWDSGHIGSRISLDSSTNLIATRNSDSSTNVDSQVYGLQITEGNRYWEVVGGQTVVGISTVDSTQSDEYCNVASGYGYDYYARAYNDGSYNGYGTTWTSTDVIGVRYCYETGELEFYKNGVSQGIAFTLTPNTSVYPAIALGNASTTATLITDESKLKYLPEECRPLGDFEFKAVVNASNNPVKAFFDDDIYVGIDIEETSDRIINTPLEPLYIHPDTADSGSNLVTLNSVAEGEEIVVNGIDAPTGSITNASTINTLDILADGSCVAAYTFDDSTANCLDSTYNGTWENDSNGNGAAYDVGVFDGKAASFDGGSWIDTNGTSIHDIINGVGTISLFLNISSMPNTNNSFISAIDSSTGGDWDYYFNVLDDGRIDIAIENGTTDYHYTTTNSLIKTNAFYHLVLTFNNNNIKIYINGEFIEEFDSTYGSVNNNINDTIGAINDKYNFTGLIDQVRIFNKALSEAEIQGLYYEQKQTIDLTNHGLTSKPVTAYKKQGIDLIFDSSTLTQFVGTIYTAKQLLDSGDNVILDNSKAVTINSVTDSLVNSVNTLDILGDGSCIATYTFDDSTANDLSGNNNGGWYELDSSGNTVSGGDAYVTGKYGLAASMTGNNAIKSGLAKPDYPFTVTLWVKNNNTADGSTIYDLKGAKLTYYTDSTGCRIWDESGKSGYSGVHLDSTFNFIAVIHTGDSSRNLYINNVQIPLTSDSSANNYNANNLVVGCRGDGDNLKDAFFTGAIDQVRIFNKALTSDEIKSLYVEQVQKYTINFDSQANAPKSLKIPDRSKTLAPVARTFDGTNFNYTMEDYKKQGRRFQRKIFAAKQGTVIEPPMQTNMYKKGS